MNQQELNVFLEGYFRETTEKFVRDTIEDLKKHKDKIAKQIIKEINQAVDKIAEYQKQGLNDIRQITISFMYSSLYFGKPVFKVQCYLKNIYVEQGMEVGNIQADWLFQYWKTYKEKLMAYLVKENTSHSIKEEKVNALMYTKIELILFYVAVMLKYMMQRYEETLTFDKIGKQEVFFITFGEYKDWQSTIYAEKPPIDLFNCKAEDISGYRKFNNKYFENKHFKEMALTNSVFRNCHFKNCTFVKCKLNDCRFIACEFQETSFRKTQILGATFKTSYLEKIKMEDCLLGYNTMKAFKLDDAYKACEFYECTLEKMIFHKSHLENVSIVGCQIKNTEVIACQVQNSLLKEYEKGEA